MKPLVCIVRIKCPHCDKPLTSLNVGGVNASDPGGNEWRVAVFGCPSCGKAIGTSFDTLAQTTHLLERIEKIVEKHVKETFDVSKTSNV